MIKTKKDLKEYMKADNEYFKNRNKRYRLKLWLSKDHDIEINKYIKYLRLDEYYSNKKSICYFFSALYYRRRRNKLGNKLGFYMSINSINKGLTIYHHGNIIINGNCRIGEGCKLHGDNCIGNDGFSKQAPVLGNNIDIGIGAKIIGDIYLANGIVIGANAVVNKSFYEEGITIAGVPARKIKGKGESNDS